MTGGSAVIGWRIVGKSLSDGDLCSNDGLEYWLMSSGSALLCSNFYVTGADVEALFTIADTSQKSSMLPC
jgi:hypothetical protein